MEKTKIGPHGFLYPMPMVIVGADVGGKPNFMPVAWVTRTNHAPPRIGVALGKIAPHERRDSRAPGVQREHPHERMRIVTDHLGLVAGRRSTRAVCSRSSGGSSRTPR